MRGWLVKKVESLRNDGGTDVPDVFSSDLYRRHKFRTQDRVVHIVEGVFRRALARLFVRVWTS